MMKEKKETSFRRVKEIKQERREEEEQKTLFEDEVQEENRQHGVETCMEGAPRCRLKLNMEQWHGGKWWENGRTFGNQEGDRQMGQQDA